MFLVLFSASSFAKNITLEEAELAAKGWLACNGSNLDSGTNYEFEKIESYTDETRNAFFYIANLQPSGFLFISADDLLEPVIIFSTEGRYSKLSDNPLVTLAIQDILRRKEALPNFQLSNSEQDTTETQRKWNHFIALGHIEETQFELMELPTKKIADIRVEPLIKSKWSQTTTCWSNPSLCYNYFTPKQYPAGCVATAMAQLMRYHKYPAVSIDDNVFNIIVDDHTWPVNLVKGSLSNGVYDWDMMPLEPNCTTTKLERQEIGALCYDVGISIGTNYNSNTAVADVLKVRDALKNVFKYGHAINGYNNTKDIGEDLIHMINPNLDAGDPVILTINKTTGNHVVLCDGYGYYSDTMYHHFNMGWSGTSDAWYNLPDVNAIDHTYTSVLMCIYNIHVTDEGNGEVISGRVVDHNGQPIADANIYAEPLGNQTIISTSTNEKGIYAFDCLNSATTYSISTTAPGYIFTEQEITTGTSINNEPVTGNIWGVDFIAELAGDLDNDGDIDNKDFAIFSSAWKSTPKDTNWNPSCDLNTPPDNIIDYYDMDILMSYWNTRIAN